MYEAIFAQLGVKEMWPIILFGTMDMLSQGGAES